MKKTKNTLLLFFISFLVIACTKQEKNLTKIEGKLIQVDSLTPAKQSFVNTISPYKEKMVTEINTVISYTPKNLVRTDGEMQSSLGNLMADLTLKKADSLFFAKTGKRVDFAMLNYGGIRSGIEKGNVTNESVFKLMPFDNTIVVVEMTAEKIKGILTYLTLSKRAHPLSKTVSIILEKNNNRIYINNKKLDKNKTYYVATTNYLQKGGDSMYFFADPVSLFESNYLLRDAIKFYFKSKDTLQTELDNRVIVKK